MDIRHTPITEIRMYDKNPRNNDTAVDKVAESIKAFGFKQPIVADKNGVIIAGHTRYKAAVKLGLSEVPVLYATDLTDAQAKAYRLADNKTAEFAEWDAGMMAAELGDLEECGFDMQPFGFDTMPAEPAEDDFDMEAALADITEPVSKRGDIYQLGRHRLMCGDSTNRDDVALLMNGQKASMIWTDPPWNVDYGGSDHPSWKTGVDRQILNDHMDSSAFRDFLYRAFTNMSEVIYPGAMVYVVMSAQEWGGIMDVMQEAGFHWSSTVIWNKDHFVLSRKDYHTQYEPIWYGWQGDDKRLCPLLDRQQSDVWDIDRPISSPEHPTMKPVEVVARSLQNSSRTHDTVIDVFGGSGTTLIACEQLGRSCRMMELDPKYVDVIIHRWETLTKEKAVKIYAGTQTLSVCADGCE